MVRGTDVVGGLRIGKAYTAPVAGELREELALMTAVGDVPDVIWQKVAMCTWHGSFSL